MWDKNKICLNTIMNMEYVILFCTLLLFGCNDNLTAPNDEEFSNYEILTKFNWNIKSIVTKYGTDNPDENVPDKQITKIDSGKIIQGEIKFNKDSTITLNNTAMEFYFYNYEEFSWELSGDKFIRFKKYDVFGNQIQSFGYNVRFVNKYIMEWYIAGIGIETGDKRVIIITIYHN
ncbi:MAG: hypothetical protein NTX22_11210 [Ignavibacteriales bacterium]|nr:hypothetical protein [Ignavibacteriales bacterium]